MFQSHLTNVSKQSIKVASLFGLAVLQ